MFWFYSSCVLYSCMLYPQRFVSNDCTLAIQPLQQVLQSTVKQVRLSAMAEPGAPWTGSNIFSYPLDPHHDGKVVALPISESDDSSETESESTSLETCIRITFEVLRSFTTIRELCAFRCGKWAWLKWRGTTVVYYNGVCFQKEETQMNFGSLSVRTNAISRDRRSALQRIIQLEDIYGIIESFFIGDLFSMCCDELCGSCDKSWFLKGWICPHYWTAAKYKYLIKPSWYYK